MPILNKKPFPLTLVTRKTEMAGGFALSATTMGTTLKSNVKAARDTAGVSTPNTGIKNLTEQKPLQLKESIDCHDILPS